jgi:hypothetical protein
MPISSVTSEALQLKLRQLLPSQQGFGTDLSASDTIIPIIDLTASAEGSDVRQDLQTALAFGSQTAFSASNSTVVLANTPGFWQITSAYSLFLNTTLTTNVDFDVTDGIATKQLLSFSSITNATTSNSLVSTPLNFLIFLTSGDSLSVTASNFALCAGSYRQIADVNGDFVNPIGFNPQ